MPPAPPQKAAEFGLFLDGNSAAYRQDAASGFEPRVNRLQDPKTARVYLRSVPERDGVHDAAGPEGEEAGDHERAGEDADHGVAVLADPVAARMQHCKRKHRQREDREKMDRAEYADEPEAVNPERTDRDHG